MFEEFCLNQISFDVISRCGHSKFPLKQKLARQLGLESVEELEVALDSLEGIAADGGELESENLSREARVRSAYLEWCKQYGKNPDESRFPVFSSNYLAMEDYAQSSGKEVTLNEFADRTESEYEQLQSRKGKVGSATVVDEVAAAAAAAAEEAERVKARAEARAKAEAERALREEAAAKERAAAAERAKKRAEEDRARQKELEAKLLALKEWQAKSEAERRALTEKERAERQKAQEQELAKLRQEKEEEAIRAARADAEREATRVAKRRAVDEEAARIARQQAKEWEAKQQQIASAKAPPKRAPVQRSVFSLVTPKKEEKKPIEAPKLEFELDLSKIVPQPKDEPKKPALDLSALNSLIPTPSLEKPKPSRASKPATSSAPLFSFFSAPQPKSKSSAAKPVVKPAATPVVPVSVPKKVDTKATPSFSFFSAPSPAPKAKVAPAPVKPASTPKAASSFSFFSPSAPKPKDAPPRLPSPKAAAPPKAAPAFSFFSSSAPATKAKPAPAPIPAPAPAKKAPASPTFSFFSSSPAPKVAPTPAASPSVSSKETKAPAFSFFSSSPAKAKATPAQAPRPSISLFAASNQPKQKAKIAPKIPNRSGTINLFGGGGAPRPAASTQPKIPKGTGTISINAQAKQAAAPKPFFSFGGAPAASKVASPQKPSVVANNIPVLSNWKQNPNGSITGLVSNSKQFKAGTEITTSPVPKGAKKGAVVKTGSGSQYLLK